MSSRGISTNNDGFNSFTPVDFNLSERSDGILRDRGGAGGDDDTAVTISAELDEAGASLPLPEEIRTSIGGGSTRRLGRNNNRSSPGAVSLKWVYLGAALSLIVLVIVIPIVTLRPSSSNNVALSSGDGATNDYTISRGADPEAAFRTRPALQDVIRYLLDNGVSSQQDLQSEGSPQNLAASWLAEEDPANLIVPVFNVTTVDGYRYMTRYIMAVNYFAMDGENWLDDMNFLSGDDICYWHSRYPNGLDLGCFCAVFDYPVPRWVHFNGVNLKNEIPTENGLMHALYSFQVQYNEELVGQIPTELCNIGIMDGLVLSHNSLTGTIPSCFGDMDVLYLILDQNLLNGTIPTTLGRVSNLKILRVQDNVLSGNLPTELANLTGLEEFSFDQNPGINGNPMSVLNKMTNLHLLIGNGCDLEGEIDDTFLADLPNIRGIDLSQNRFTTSPDTGLPVHLFNKPILEVLDLSLNDLQGPLPTDIQPDEMPYLNFVSLYDNQLSGELPEALANLVGLDHLDLSMNSFSGSIPDYISEFQFMRFLFLSVNSFKPGPIPDTFANLTLLEELSLRGLARTGPLPTYLGNFSRLELLDLSSNDLMGEIPEGYSGLTELEYLLLSNNPEITGVIPSTFKNLTKLQGFFIDGTAISGDLDTICQLPNFADNTARPQEGIFADCKDGLITCSCDCACYDGEDGGEGSQPLLGNLDASIDIRFRRSNLNVKFNILNNTGDFFDNDEIPGDD